MNWKDIASIGLIFGIAGIALAIGTPVKGSIEYNQTMELVQWMPMTPFLIAGAIVILFVVIFTNK